MHAWQGSLLFHFATNIAGMYDTLKIEKHCWNNADGVQVSMSCVSMAGMLLTLVYLPENAHKLKMCGDSVKAVLASSMTGTAGIEPAQVNKTKFSIGSPYLLNVVLPIWKHAVTCYQHMCSSMAGLICA